MKRIVGIDQKINHPDLDENPLVAARQQDEMPSYRRLLKMICFGIPPTGADESEHMHQVKLKLMIAGSDIIDLEDSEFSMIKKYVDSNKMQWGGHVHYAVMKLLRDAEQRKIEVKI